MCGECNWPMPKVEKKMEWIEVEKKLPQLYVDVLLFLKDRMFVGARTPSGFLSDKGYIDYDSEPSHWMPLPPIPGSI